MTCVDLHCLAGRKSFEIVYKKSFEKYFSSILIYRNELNVSKVSTRFAYFLSRFAPETVLILILLVLDAEFYSLPMVPISMGIIEQKYESFLKILLLLLCKALTRVFLV